ncbi:MAG: hypothetical protein LBG24_02315 [Treponema sp.]|nr:hypothetical protein [Treponema sp.]
MSIFERVEKFVKDIFRTTLEIFLEALQLNKSARGYIHGSITELLLKKELEIKYGCEVYRIREKWEGRKHSKHHGDFYFRRNQQSPWFVIESKGVKSNSEKWHKLYNYDNLKRFLYTHSDKIAWINPSKELESQIIGWIETTLPKFFDEYKNNVYDYEEIQKYINNKPSRETDKFRAIALLSGYNRDEINDMIQKRVDYVMTKVKVLETHFVSGTSGSSERTQATPRKDEFNLISIDIILRYHEHKFVFANPKLLESSGDNEDHLQQNYIMGFVFTGKDGKPQFNFSEEWYEDFNKVYETINKKDAVNESDMQKDIRVFISDEDE